MDKNSTAAFDLIRLGGLSNSRSAKDRVHSGILVLDVDQGITEFTPGLYPIASSAANNSTGRART